MTFAQVYFHSPTRTHNMIAKWRLPKHKHQLVPNIHHWTHNTMYYYTAAQQETWVTTELKICLNITISYLDKLYEPLHTLILILIFTIRMLTNGQSQWSCGLRRRTAAARLPGIEGSNPIGSMDVCLLFSVVCCQVEVSVMGWSIIQRSPTECGVSECDREVSIMRRPWPTGGLSHHGKKKKFNKLSHICCPVRTTNFGQHETQLNLFCSHFHSYTLKPWL